MASTEITSCLRRRRAETGRITASFRNAVLAISVTCWTLSRIRRRKIVSPVCKRLLIFFETRLAHVLLFQFNFVTASAGAFCGNKIVEAGEECDCGYDDNECVDKCCYPRQISDLDKMKNDTAKGCTRKSGTQCRYAGIKRKFAYHPICVTDVSSLFHSPSQGPCCSSESCQFVPLSKNVQCKAESDCSYNSTCNGRSSECPPPLPRANKTRCNEGTQVKRGIRWIVFCFFFFFFSLPSRFV